jgi:hypothetical protein
MLLFFSGRTAMEAFLPTAGYPDPHVGALALVEAVGAALFLLPRTLRGGGVLLLLTLGVAFSVHAGVGQFRGDLLVYGAGTWLVMIHGPGWVTRTPLVRVAA